MSICNSCYLLSANCSYFVVFFPGRTAARRALNLRSHLEVRRSAMWKRHKLESHRDRHYTHRPLHMSIRGTCLGLLCIMLMVSTICLFLVFWISKSYQSLGHELCRMNDLPIFLINYFTVLMRLSMLVIWGGGGDINQTVTSVYSYFSNFL